VTVYSTNVHVYARGTKRHHRVRLTVEPCGAVRFVEHYIDGDLAGCGGALVMLPPAVREECEARLAAVPPEDFPMYWRREPHG
jgi:hypothetical protein